MRFAFLFFAAIALGSTMLLSPVYAHDCSEVPPSDPCQTPHDHGGEQSVFDADADMLGLPEVEVGPGLITMISNIVFSIIGSLSTVFIVVGGLRYTISAGSPEQIQKAKNTILYAVVGLLVSVFAFTLVNFVIFNL